MAAKHLCIETYQNKISIRERETDFSLDTVYAAGDGYQPLIRRLEAAGRAGLPYQLTQRERNALMQNIRDVLTHSYHEAVKGCPHSIIALTCQAQLGRWRYLNQLPIEAQTAFRNAMARFNISILGQESSS